MYNTSRQPRRRIPGARRARTVPLSARALVILAAGLLLVSLAGIHRAATDSARAPAESKTATWELVLVNDEHPLPAGFSVETVEVPGGERVDARIEVALSDMLQAAEDAGYRPFVRSGFRTRDQQEEILSARIGAYEDEGYSKEAARAEALAWVALPGTSEHELGLAVDINERNGDDGLYRWLADNAADYGFIQRYPPDKTDITGIAHEPWHYRYVGVDAARQMEGSGLCLEEYLAR